MDRRSLSGVIFKSLHAQINSSSLTDADFHTRFKASGGVPIRLKRRKQKRRLDAVALILLIIKEMRRPEKKNRVRRVLVDVVTRRPSA